MPFDGLEQFVATALDSRYCIQLALHKILTLLNFSPFSISHQICASYQLPVGSIPLRQRAQKPDVAHVIMSSSWLSLSTTFWMRSARSVARRPGISFQRGERKGRPPSLIVCGPLQHGRDFIHGCPLFVWWMRQINAFTWQRKKVFWRSQVWGG